MFEFKKINEVTEDVLVIPYTAGENVSGSGHICSLEW